MDPRLQQAIENDDVDELHRLIVEDRKLLDRASKGPFPNTPLHIAAAAGKTQVAMEVAILKPSFARKLNPEGYSPMHLALQHEHYHTTRALMTLNPKLIRVRGRCGITSLHYVAGKKGDIESEHLAEFLSACKSSIKDLTSQCETAVHIAVKNHNLNAFKVLFGWLKRVRLTQILDWKDQDGNTVLHIASSDGQLEIIKLLIGYTTVKAKNFQGKTALEIFRVNPSGDEDLANRLCGLRRRAITPTFSLSQFFSRELTAFEKYANFFSVLDESARNIILVVCTLIAAATYQTALTPPGGYWSDSSSNSTANSNTTAVEKPHQAGDIILSGSRLYRYAICNTMAFFTSIATIWATTFTVEANPLFYIPVPLLCAAYFISCLVQLPLTNLGPAYVMNGLIALFLSAVLCLPLGMRIMHLGVQQRIDATRRRVATFEDRRTQCNLLVLFFFTILVMLALVF